MMTFLEQCGSGWWTSPTACRRTSPAGSDAAGMSCPGERRDPYAAASRLTARADAFATTNIGGYGSRRSPGRHVRDIHAFTPDIVTRGAFNGWCRHPGDVAPDGPDRGAGFTDLTAEVVAFVKEAHARAGAVTLFIRHTSASLTIQENADPSVLADLMSALERIAPDDAGWTHDAEGLDDMPAHVKTMLTAISLQIPVLKATSRWEPGRRSI